MKRCVRCGEVQPEAAYRRHPHTRDGLALVCKTCQAARRFGARRRATK